MLFYGVGRSFAAFGGSYAPAYVIIVACYHPLPLSACMLHFDLVSILFGTSIPTSFNILVKMFLHLFHCFFTVCSNTYKPTDFCPLPCIPISRIASNCQWLLHHLLYKYCLLSTTAGQRTQRSNRHSQKRRSKQTTLCTKLTSRVSKPENAI